MTTEILFEAFSDELEKLSANRMEQMIAAGELSDAAINRIAKGKISPATVREAMARKMSPSLGRATKPTNWGGRSMKLPSMEHLLGREAKEDLAAASNKAYLRSKRSPRAEPIQGPSALKKRLATHKATSQESVHDKLQRMKDGKYSVRPKPVPGEHPRVTEARLREKRNPKSKTPAQPAPSKPKPAKPEKPAPAPRTNKPSGSGGGAGGGGGSSGKTETPKTPANNHPGRWVAGGLIGGGGVMAAIHRQKKMVNEYGSDRGEG